MILIECNRDCAHEKIGLADIGRKRGAEGLNSECLAYKLMANEKRNGLTRHEQVHVCGVVLEGGSDIVSLI